MMMGLGWLMMDGADHGSNYGEKSKNRQLKKENRSVYASNRPAPSTMSLSDIGCQIIHLSNRLHSSVGRLG
jgi:hypothetical protein